jgi:hypothetical protein
MLWGDAEHKAALHAGGLWLSASPVHVEDMGRVLRGAIARWRSMKPSATGKIGGDLMALEAANAALSACLGAPVSPTDAAAWGARTRAPILKALGEESSRAMHAHPDSATRATAPVWLEINRWAWRVDGLFRPDSPKRGRRGPPRKSKAKAGGQKP